MELVDSKRRIFWLVTVWIVAHGILLCLSRTVFNQLMWYNVRLPPFGWGMVILNWLILLAAEAILIAFLASWSFGALRGGERRCFSRVGGLVGLAAGFGYLFLIIFSWEASFLKGSFPTLSEVGLLALLIDWSTWKHWILATDLERLWRALAILGVVSIVLLFWVPPWMNLKKSFRLVYFSLGLVVIAAVLTRLLLLGSNPSLASQIRLLGSHFVGPELSLFGRHLFYPNKETWRHVPLELTSAYSLTDYRNRVAPDYQPPFNIFVFVIEGMRYDVLASGGGDPKIVPRMNQLAATGLSFERAYVVSPETIYTLNTLITGLHPLKGETRDLNYDIDYSYVRIYDLLASAGYRTAYLTTETPSSRRLSYSDSLDLYSDPQAESMPRGAKVWGRELDSPVIYTAALKLAEFDRLNIDRLKDWISTHAQEQTGLFALTYLTASHLPYYTPVQGKEIYPANELALPEEAMISFFSYAPEFLPVMLKRYWNTLHYLDNLIGEVVDQLQGMGVLRQSVLIITGDHGQLFYEHNAVGHGGRLYEPAIRVPLIISPRPNVEQPINIAQPISHLDFAPTIVELAGLPPHDGFQGQSLFRAPYSSEPLFVTVQASVFEDAVIDYPFKLVQDLRLNLERMHHLEQDPEESQNIIDQDPQIAAQLRDALTRFRSTQLSYYQSPGAIKIHNFPPQTRR